MILRPGKDGIRGEFRAVVGDDHPRFAAPFDEDRQFASDATTQDRGARDRRQAFAGHVFDEVEHAKPPSASELVVNEIQRASGIGLRFDQDRATRADSAAPAFLLANGKSFFAIEPVDAVDPNGAPPPAEAAGRRSPVARSRNRATSL
ncbi:hypothetical protein RHECIAT_PB0000002 (plasmid) [Rhizobium etli CIAT 652]|uniref:Uncharacterized protein n=1 Tax=Rhizobium etli (strain CIAT 652) TaxID=491916 RepID=B3Q223_RHIE6|nr:hypothetical protein RHECIAT_PB0000002 [Rhizobium etli CIAT 652]